MGRKRYKIQKKNKILCSGDTMEEICKLKHEQRTIGKKWK